MNEADVRLQISHALQWHGHWPRHSQDGRMINGVLFTPEIKGLPDIETRHPKFPNELIEVKVVKRDDKAFSFNQIEKEQREYLDNWLEAGGKCYLAIGKIVPMGSKSKIHSIAVFTWLLWKVIEQNSLYKSIPYSWELYDKKPAEWEKIADIVSFPSEYFLWKAGSDWRFDRRHPLAIPPLVQVPFFKRVRQTDDILQ